MSFMNDTGVISITIAFFTAIGFLAGFVTGVGMVRTQVIEHSCGQHNPQTGDFEWLPST